MATNNNTNGPNAANGLTASGRTISTIAVTKGDMIAGSGSSTSTLLTPGTAYQVLNANSANANGFGWDNGLTASNNNNRIFGYGNSASNFTYPNYALSTTSSPGALTANTIYFIPFTIYISTTFTKIGVNVTTGAASSNIRLGIYNTDNTGGYPGTLVLDAGTVNSSGTGDLTVTISQALYDKYWLCLISNGTPSLRNCQVSASDGNAWYGMNSFATSTSTAGITIASVSSYYTALPSTIVGVTVTRTTFNHLIYLQV